ncbi:hypothetical protein [Azospirillum sp. Sh1]|uniref:hypothetical protein n=1 Tax=Azospirillum sp. Sh1 TaxID=2607285 RepID=UPI0011EDE4ED|nr:hypothetical protein [Azospirillum sp. Sh1]KAA0571067.1 hypothetical protein FZ029_27835 [Azospirillum sp. Sh1]
MTINTTNLSAVLQQKIDALSATSEFKDLLLLAKTIEAAAGNASVSDVLSAGATQVAEVNSAGSTQVGNVNSAAASKIAAINALDAVLKRSMQSYTFETIDLNSLNTVGETRYVDAANSPNAPAGSAGYGYYMGLAGGDVGGTLGLQHLVAQNGRYWWRDKYGGGWREFWHTGNLTPATAPNANTVAARTPDGSLLGNHLYARTSDISSNGTTLIALGSNSDALDAYFQMNSSTNTTAPAGARGLALVVNTGAFGIYTGRVSPVVQLYMDPTTKQFTFYKSVAPNPVTVPFSPTVTLDFASSNRFDLTATSSFTLANPSNMKPGQVVVLNVTSSVANIVMATGSFFRTKGGSGISLSATAGARDKVIMECVAAGVVDITVQRDWK